MIICWDNLEKYDIYLTKRNNFKSRKTGSKFTYIESCKNCGESYFARKELLKKGKGLFCSSYCYKEGYEHSEEIRKKISKGKKGKKFSEEHKRNLRKNHADLSGSNHPMWKGGISKKNIPLYDTYALQIEYAEKVRKTVEEYLEVRCTYCGKWFMPTIKSVTDRVRALDGKILGESRLYCSDTCKKECPIYRKQKYSTEENGSKQYSREVQPELRQMVLERDNYTCQNPECKATESLHCHHKEGIRWEPLESADIDMCITYCKDCHKSVHQKEGCGYYEMRCINKNERMWL